MHLLPGGCFLWHHLSSPQWCFQTFVNGNCLLFLYLSFMMFSHQLTCTIFGSIHYKVFRYYRLDWQALKELHSALWQPMILLLCKRLSNTMPKLFFLFSSSKCHGTMLHSYGLTINHLTRIATQMAGIRGRYRLRWYSNCWESRVGWSGIPCAAHMLSQLMVN